MAIGENNMVKSFDPATPLKEAEAARIERTVELIVERSNRRAELQPADVRAAMESYLHPYDRESKPWETWL